jgi:DNA modification methylase
MPEKNWDYADLEQSERQYGVHFFHQYAARFIPQIPARLLKENAKPNDIVVDPFMGSGTTLLEARYLGFNSYGLDTNPLAVKIVRAKTLVLNEKRNTEINQFIKWLYGHKEQGIENLKNIPQMELFTGSKNWFREDVEYKISSILLELEKYSPEVVNFIEIGLSHLLKGMSNARMDSVIQVLPKEPVYIDRKHYYREVNNLTRDIPVYNRLFSRLMKMKKAIEEYNKKINGNIICQPVLGDARRLSKYFLYSNIVITSPPYWSAQNYEENNYLSLKLFGLKIEKGEEIGRDAGSYLHDMELVFLQIAKILKGMFILVIGEDQIKFTHEKLLKTAVDIGFTCTDKIERKISNQGSRAKLIQKEFIYLLNI